MSKVSHASYRAASRHLAHVASNLDLAGKHLIAATRSANRYESARLRRLIEDLDKFSAPIRRLAELLPKGGYSRTGRESLR
jgi:hypothetical protein